MTAMRLIILAAGQGFKLDGYNKILLTDPRTGEPLLTRYRSMFPDWDITVVVGFKAIRVMSAYPQLHYVYNDRWSMTGNSYSLSLALDERPSVVMSSDLFFDDELAGLVRDAPANAVFGMRSENKQPNTVRVATDGATVSQLYSGDPRDHAHPESLGIFKVSDPDLLLEWKRRCARECTVFAAHNLPVDRAPLAYVDKGDAFFHEVNSHFDYLALLERHRRSR